MHRTATQGIVLGLAVFLALPARSSAAECTNQTNDCAPLNSQQNSAVSAVMQATEQAGAPGEPTTGAPPSTYDKTYPLYAVECAGTKYDEKGAAPGGAFGHAFVYLKGACRDTSAPYPRIKVCDPGSVDLTQRNSGVGLSLDKNFSNTRYVATDGFDTLINGDLPDNQPLDTQHFDATIQKVVASGALNGVKLTSSAEKAKPAGMSDQEWTAREIVSSSFADRFGRNLNCVSVPINSRQLQAAVDWVNQQDEPYESGQKSYHWNAISDNCVSFAHNIFAAMGIGKPAVQSGNPLASAYVISSVIWEPWKTKFQVPENDVLSTQERAGEAKLPNVQQAYANTTVRDNFEKFGVTTATPGVVLWSDAAHSDDNQIFNIGAKATFLELPVIRNRSKRLDKELTSPEATDIQANLIDYRQRLQNTIQGQKSCADLKTQDPQQYGTSDFQQFCQSYTAYLNRTLSDVDSKIQALAAHTPAPSPTN